MVVRKIVHIDEELCDGCGDCIPNCAEEALQIVDGKAKIVKDLYCDGLGACLGHCPQSAISIVERETAPFDEKAVQDHLSKRETARKKEKKATLRQWPIQLNLVPLESPSYEDADLLITADCVPVVYPEFHETMLSGKRIVIGCPKFDDFKAYAHKLGEILKRNRVRSITILRMEVPCCSGLKWIVDKAIEAAGKQIPVRCHVITIEGEMK
ncbi:MAG: 4Fe-4S ferredoxin [Candidatus Bathyarchaeota archaeon]|nr:MAG: 4Fe-4S ferredoxin [Candidatus Bathyarchaeota archaeon]